MAERKNKKRFTFSQARYDKAVKRQNEYNFLGFAIFDFVHIIAAIYLLVHVLRHHEGEALELSECIIEIVLSLALIGFIDALAEKRDGPPDNRFFTYAWLLASASLAIPSIINGFYLSEIEDTTALAFKISLLCIDVTMFLLFFLSMFTSKYIRLWKVFLYLGMILFGISGIVGTVGFSLLEAFHESGIHIAADIISLIKNTIPVVPSVLGLISLYRVDTEYNGQLL